MSNYLYPDAATQYPVEKSKQVHPVVVPKNIGYKTLSPDLLDYLKERHVSPNLFTVIPGVYQSKAGLVFVLRNVDNVLAYTERLLPPVWNTYFNTEQRFRNPVGINIGEYVWHTVNFNGSDTLIITEGVFDAVKAYLAGFSVLSILGSNLTPDRVELINKLVEYFAYRSVIYIPDNDGPGLAVIKRLSQHRLYVPVMFLPPEYKDLGKMPMDEVVSFLANLKLGGKIQ